MGEEEDGQAEEDGSSTTKGHEGTCGAAMSVSWPDTLSRGVREANRKIRGIFISLSLARDALYHGESASRHDSRRQRWELTFHTKRRIECAQRHGSNFFSCISRDTEPEGEGVGGVLVVRRGKERRRRGIDITMVAMAKMNKGKKSGAAPTAAGREGGGRKGKGGAGKQRVGKGKGADDEDSEAEEKDLEVKESLWLGKALRRQQVAEEIEEQKAAKRQTGKEQGGAKGGDEDVTDESSEGEPEKLGSFTFDADDDTVDEVVSGWKFKGMGGAAHRPDYAGRLTGIDEKIKKRARKMEIEEDSDDEIAMRESDEDDDEEDGGESEEGKDDDDDEDEDEDEGEDEDDSAHQSEEEEDEDERLGSRIKEEESEEGEGGDDEDDEDDDEEESEEEEEEEDNEAKVKEKKKQKEMMAEQLKREKEAAFFDDAPVPAASTQDTFASLHLSRPFLKATNAMGFTSPTSIQSMVIPIALQGKDVCASSRTGSGKTAAFSLPFLERLLHRPRRVACTRVLILTPTRELAVQGHAMIENLAQFTDIRCYIVIGGVKNQVQEIELRKKPDVVVATPGRMLDHLRNAAGISLDGLEILILDEADRLLEMGFTEEVEELVKLCPVKRQTMLFSATMTHDVDRLAAYSLKRPVRVTADSSIRTEEEGNLNKVAVPKTLNQEFIRIRKEHEGDREAILLCLCTRSFHTKTIIFCREKKRAHRLRLIFGLSNLKVNPLSPRFQTTHPSNLRHAPIKPAPRALQTCATCPTLHAEANTNLLKTPSLAPSI